MALELYKLPRACQSVTVYILRTRVLKATLSGFPPYMYSRFAT